MTSYAPQPIYRLLALVSLAMTALFAWELSRSIGGGSVEVGAVLFFAVSIGLLAWTARTAMTQVTLTPSQLIVAAPLSAPLAIEFGQVLSVTEEGRMNQSIVVVYHPRSDDGMMNLDAAKSVTLPAVRDQDALLAELVRRTPA